MASILRFDQWYSTGSKPYGTVIQVVTNLVNEISTWSAPIDGNTVITPLSISITPKFINSKIIVQWMINGEVHHDTIFRIFKNSSLASNGRNLNNNSRWNGYLSANYDLNNDSTPSNYAIFYTDTPNSTSSTTYQLTVGASGATAYTFGLNRTIASAGADAYENMVSSVVAWEIAQ